jgi:hypothetical protein
MRDESKGYYANTYLDTRTARKGAMANALCGGRLFFIFGCLGVQAFKLGYLKEHSDFSIRFPIFRNERDVVPLQGFGPARRSPESRIRRFLFCFGIWKGGKTPRIEVEFFQVFVVGFPWELVSGSREMIWIAAAAAGVQAAAAAVQAAAAAAGTAAAAAAAASAAAVATAAGA